MRDETTAPPAVARWRSGGSTDRSGSSASNRHAFNEFWSFFAAWGQMLNYVIVIAIFRALP